MLFIISGGNGSGKSTCIPLLKAELPDVHIVDFDDIGVPENADTIWRQKSTEDWLQIYMQQSSHMVICGGMVLGEIISCPSFNNIEDIHVCFLDCSDIVRINRFRQRKQEYISQDLLNWASWLRVHHHSPQWEQHVITGNSWAKLDFNLLKRIENWEEALSRPYIFDTSGLSEVAVANKLTQWIDTILHK